MRGASTRRTLIDIAIVLSLCFGVYWTLLGERPLVDSEGHRVVPAWEMLHTGNLFVPTLFGQPYLRKPPGLTWAIVASAAMLGESEFSARAVSAASMTLLSIAAYLAAQAWFGRRWGVWSGIATALTPWFWASGRAAEIEAMNLLGTGVAVMALLHLMVWRTRATRRDVPLVLVAIVGIVIAGLAKGPAAAPCFAAAAIASVVVRRSARPIFNVSFLGVCAVSATALALVGWAILDAMSRARQEVVQQAPSEFLWNDPLGTLALIPVAIMSALPFSLAAILPWDAGAARDARASAADVRALRMARAISLTTGLSLVLYVLAGVDNNRYAMPAFSFLPVLAAYLCRGLATNFTGRRRTATRAMMLGSPFVLMSLLTIGAGVYIAMTRHVERSGRETGREIAATLHAGDRVYAADAIEARPDVLLYAQRAAREQGKTIEVHWIPRFERLPRNLGGSVLLLRTDERSHDPAVLAERKDVASAERLGEWKVHEFEFVLLRPQLHP